MATPQTPSLDERRAFFIYDEETGTYKAWNGSITDASPIGSGEPGTKVTEVNSHLLEEILNELKLGNLYLEEITGSRLTKNDII